MIDKKLAIFALICAICSIQIVYFAKSQVIKSTKYEFASEPIPRAPRPPPPEPKGRAVSTTRPSSQVQAVTPPPAESGASPSPKDAPDGPAAPAPRTTTAPKAQPEEGQTPPPALQGQWAGGIELYAILGERPDIKKREQDLRAQKFIATIGSMATMMRGRCTLVVERLRLEGEPEELVATITVCIDDTCGRPKTGAVKDKIGPVANAVLEDGRACLGSVYRTPSEFPLAEP